MKYAVWIRKFNTSACVHVEAKSEDVLKCILVNDYNDKGWEVEKYQKIA